MPQVARERGGDDDPIHKIQPLVTHLSSKLISIPIGEKLAINKQMVALKVRQRL